MSAVQNAVLNAVSGGRQAIVGEIAAALGEGWSVNPRKDSWSHNYFEIQHADGRRIDIAFFESDYYDRSKRNRIAIDGDYPSDKSGNFVLPYHPETRDVWECPRITVSQMKTAAKIASEIKSRFLDAYTARYKAVVDYVDAEQRRGQEIAETVKRLHAVVGGYIAKYSHSEEPKRICSYRSIKNDRRVSVDVEVGAEDYVTVKVIANSELAEIILRACKVYADAHQEEQ